MTRIDLNDALAEAAMMGHVSDVRLMLDLGATDYNYALVSAAWGGHLDIVRLMLDLGATNYDGAMEEAARGHRLELMRSSVGLAGPESGHQRIVALMATLGATASEDMGRSYYDDAMVIAARDGDAPSVQMLLDHGATSHSAAIAKATTNGHLDVVRLLSTQ